MKLYRKLVILQALFATFLVSSPFASHAQPSGSDSWLSKGQSTTGGSNPTQELLRYRTLDLKGFFSEQTQTECAAQFSDELSFRGNCFAIISQSCVQLTCLNTGIRNLQQSCPAIRQDRSGNAYRLRQELDNIRAISASLNCKVGKDDLPWHGYPPCSPGMGDPSDVPHWMEPTPTPVSTPTPITTPPQGADCACVFEHGPDGIRRFVYTRGMELPACRETYEREFRGECITDLVSLCKVPRCHGDNGQCAPGLEDIGFGYTCKMNADRRGCTASELEIKKDVECRQCWYWSLNSELKPVPTLSCDATRREPALCPIGGCIYYPPVAPTRIPGTDGWSVEMNCRGAGCRGTCILYKWSADNRCQPEMFTTGSCAPKDMVPDDGGSDSARQVGFN